MTTEYGARIIQTGNVYMRDYNQQTVTDWMAEMASAGPCRLVMRVWDGDTVTNWTVIEGVTP